MPAMPVVASAHTHSVCVVNSAAHCAVLVSAERCGAGPLRDASGVQLCELGRHRLSFKRKGKYKYGAGLVCQECYNNQIRPQASSHKQQQQQQQQPTTPAKRALLRDTTLLQTPERISHLQNTVRTNGIGQQGRSRSADENALMLLALNESA